MTELLCERNGAAMSARDGAVADRGSRARRC